MPLLALLNLRKKSARIFCIVSFGPRLADWFNVRLIVNRGDESCFSTPKEGGLLPTIDPKWKT